MAITNEATRLFLQSDLLAIADRHGKQMEVDGVIYQRHEPGTVRYFTLCGALNLERRRPYQNSVPVVGIAATARG